MIDVQNTFDSRGVPIQKVGVKNVRYPVRVLDRKEGYQSTVSLVSMYVDLPHCAKGTHMSRLIEVLHEHAGEITLTSVGIILREMVEKLESQSAHLEIQFPYFIEKAAPVSQKKSLMDYECTLRAKYDAGSDRTDMVLQVKVPVTSLCPCSKEISDRGAHNQRCEVVIQVRCCAFVWIEELVEIAESASSGGLYALLKREDEKYVTESAYDNPVFVEDMVRDVALRLKEDKRITWFRVESENFESIHNHSAYAHIEEQK